MPSLPVLALAKPQTVETCTLVPNCCQKCAKTASAGNGKISNSSDMHISAKLLSKVCQVCQCWHWQNFKQQQHAHQCQNAAKSVPSLPVLALPNFLAMAWLSLLALIWCCQAQWVVAKIPVTRHMALTNLMGMALQDFINVGSAILVKVYQNKNPASRKVKPIFKFRGLHEAVEAASFKQKIGF